jgi:hypothetical protein
MDNQPQLDTIPKELLIEIFTPLKSKDLLALTLTCKRFNDVISHSKRLMDRLVLSFHGQTQKLGFCSTRNYTRVHMLRNYQGNPLHFAGPHMWDIRCVYLRMDLWTLKALLNACPNLKRLVLVHLYVLFTSSDICEPLPRLELDSLSTNGDRRLFRLLMECTTKSLTVYRVHNDPQELKIMQQYLKRQTKLRKLEFTNFREDFRLFEGDSLCDVDFRLRELQLHNFKAFDTHNFVRFVENHRGSLTSVTLKQYKVAMRSHAGFLGEILEIFRDIKSVRNLTLKGFELGNIKKFHWVESLELEDYFKVDADLHEKFPNVRRLALMHCRTIQHVENFARIESLTIGNYKFESTLRLPNLRCLRLESVVFLCEQPFGYDMQVEAMTVVHAQDASWIVDFLRCGARKMKSLRIIDCKLKKSAVKYIEGLSRAVIGELKIVQRAGFVDDDDEHEFDDVDTESEYFGENEEAEADESDDDDDETEGSDGSEDGEAELAMLMSDVGGVNLEFNEINDMKRRRLE